MMKKAAFKWIAAFLLFLNLFPLMAEAKADIPDPAGDIYVQDFAGLLSSEQKAELNQLGRNLDDATTAQVAVLTVDTLDGTSIEEYSNEAFREYGIGSEEEDNGVLLVIAVDDQAVRIEVGYGLEGALPDGKVGRILDEYTIPYLQDGQYDQAIIETYKVLYNDVATEYNWDGEQVDTVPYEEQGDNPLWLILIGVVIVIVVMVDMLFFGGALTRILLIILARGGNGGGHGGGGGGHRGGGGGSSGGGGASRHW